MQRRAGKASSAEDGGSNATDKLRRTLELVEAAVNVHLDAWNEALRDPAVFANRLTDATADGAVFFHAIRTLSIV
jgi:hypothetical protein